MAWQAFALDKNHGDAWNGIPLEQAHVLHFHGSRDADTRVEIMTGLAKQLGITVDSAE
jgi:hypothetical protein